MSYGISYRSLAQDAWNEGDHPRNQTGQFGSSSSHKSEQNRLEEKAAGFRSRRQHGTAGQYQTAAELHGKAAHLSSKQKIMQHLAELKKLKELKPKVNTMRNRF